MAWGSGAPPEQLIYEMAQLRGEEELQKLRTPDSNHRSIDFADEVRHDTRRSAVYVVVIIILIALCLGIIWLVA